MMLETIETLWMGVDALSAWMLTYWIHSFVLLGIAAAATAWLKLELPLLETLWKTALLGGLVTATVQLGLDIDPLVGGWSIGAQPSASVATRGASVPTHEPTRSTLETSAYFVPAVQPVAVNPPLSANESVRAGHSDLPAAVAPSSALPGGAATRWDAARRALTLTWSLSALLLLVSLALTYGKLRRRLRTRRQITDRQERDTLDHLVAASRTKRSVDLFASDSICVPLARGVRSREIYLPERLLPEMTDDRKELVLAHELAHLERRDPAWLLATRILEAILCAQPLNRYARRQLQEIAEYRADDWAVHHTGRPIGLARCLTDVAEWSQDPAAWVSAPAMAVRKGRLARRVSRLLARDYPLPEAPRPRWLLPALGLALITLAVVVPGVGIATAAVDVQQSYVAPPAPPAPAEQPEVPDAPQAAPQTAVDPSDAPKPTPIPMPTPAPAPFAPIANPATPSAPAVPIAPDLSRLSALAAELAELELAQLAQAEAKIAGGAMSAIGGEQMERIAALSAELAALATPSPEVLVEISELAEQLAAHVTPEIEARLADAAWRLAEAPSLTPEERERLRAEMRQLVESMKPSIAERARIQAQIRALAERAQPTAEERQRLEREIEAARRQLQEHRAEIIERREELRQHRRELEIERQEMQRTIEKEVHKTQRRLETERRHVQREIEAERRARERAIRDETRRRLDEAPQPDADRDTSGDPE